MSLFDKVREQIKKNAEMKKQGKYIGIPMPFAKLGEFIPTIDKGQSIGILGGTGVGKSLFTRYLFIYSVYEFYKKTGYPVRVLFFPLEDNPQKVYRFFLQHYLDKEHGIRITTRELDSKADRMLPDFVQDVLDESDEYFKDFEKIVKIMDVGNKPSSIYDACEKYALRAGKVNEEGKYESDIHLIGVFDNLSNLDEQGYTSEKNAMTVFSRDYVREKLVNFYNFTCVSVLQADFQTERQQFSSNGESVVGKLEPSLASVGESKTITRSMHLVYSLFAPYRYDILQYPKPPKTDVDNCYNIELMKNKFISLKVIKSNDSEVGIRVGLFVDYMNGNFIELPSPKTDELRRFYQTLTKDYKPYTKQKMLEIVTSDDEDLPFS